ncbi:hypothetical protein [Nostoc sp. TCL240-02]|nr:hypothetical protein [Nostoc sp. TCL240-02]
MSVEILVRSEAGVIPLLSASVMSFAALETMDYALIALLRSQNYCFVFIL